MEKVHSKAAAASTALEDIADRLSEQVHSMSENTAVAVPAIVLVSPNYLTVCPIVLLLIRHVVDVWRTATSKTFSDNHGMLLAFLSF